MTTPEGRSEHPEWEGAIVGMVVAAEHGMIPREEIIPTMGQVCMELMQHGILTDLGELQAYLRARRSYVQLIAHPFEAEKIPQPGVRCVDIVTGEPKSHWLMVSVGEDGYEAAAQLHALAMSDEVNEATLTHDTGMLTI